MTINSTARLLTLSRAARRAFVNGGWGAGLADAGAGNVMVMAPQSGPMSYVSK